MKQTLLLLISSIAMTCFANAATLIDFSNATAAGAGADSNGNFWTTLGTVGLHGNTGADVSAFNLIDSTNTATTIDLSVDFSATDRNGWGGNGINGPTGSNPFDQSFAVKDGIYSSLTSGLVTLTFSDLAVSTVYDLSLIGGRASTGTDGLIAITTGTGSGGTLLNNNIGTQLDLSITSDALGVIAFTFVDSNNNFNTSATLNAMSITAVPEPSSAAALIGLCSLALVLRRRR